MIWQAIVPLKPPAARKRRLAQHLSPDARKRLSDALFDHVVAALRATPAIDAVHLLAEDRPPEWDGDWIRDEGRGLNPELEAARVALGAVPLLVIHADLPLVDAADISALLDRAGRDGVAIASDRHGTGTNAIALMPGQAFRFAFGIGSLSRHGAQAEPPPVACAGLALDCDTPDDLDRAIADGFVFAG